MTSEGIQAGTELCLEQGEGTHHQIQHSVHGERGVAREEGFPARVRESHSHISDLPCLESKYCVSFTFANLMCFGHMPGIQ